MLVYKMGVEWSLKFYSVNLIGSWNLSGADLEKRPGGHMTLPLGIVF